MTTRRAEALLPVGEVAELWRCSVDHVYDLIAKGRLATVQLGTGRRAKTRVPESELAAYVQRNRRRAGRGLDPAPAPVTPLPLPDELDATPRDDRWGLERAA